MGEKQGQLGQGVKRAAARVDCEATLCAARRRDMRGCARGESGHIYAFIAWSEKIASHAKSSRGTKHQNSNA